MVQYIITNTDGSKSAVQTVDAIKTFNPTLSTACQVGNFVYYDESGAQWDLFDGRTGPEKGSILGLGVIDGDLNIVHFGLITGLSNLIADTTYYANEGELGGITTTVANVKVLRTRSTTEALVDVEVESTGTTSDYTYTTASGLHTEGYFLGVGGDTNYGNAVYKLTWSNQYTGTVSSTLSLSFSSNCGISGNVYTYTLGGYSSGGNAVAERVTHSNENISANTSELPTHMADQGGYTDPKNYGYTTGGQDGPGTTVHQTDFSNDNIAANDSALPTGRNNTSGVGDASTEGWTCGGTGSSAVDKMTFSSTDIAANTSTLTVVRTSPTPASDSGTSGYGYICGGGGPLDSIDRLTFSDDNISANSSALPETRTTAHGTAIGDSVTYGYFGGGQTGAGVKVDTIVEITFSNSQTGTISSTLASTFANDRGGASEEG